MIATLPTPCCASSVMSRVILAATAFTYGQWLQMNITTVPLAPRTEASVWRRPSVPGRSNGGGGGAKLPGGCGQADHVVLVAGMQGFGRRARECGALV